MENKAGSTQRRHVEEQQRVAVRRRWPPSATVRGGEEAVATVGGSPLGAAEASRESAVAGREASRAGERVGRGGDVASESRSRLATATASGRECGGGLEWRWEVAAGGEEPAAAHPAGESQRREGASESGEEARRATGRERESRVRRRERERERVGGRVKRGGLAC